MEKLTANRCEYKIEGGFEKLYFKAHLFTNKPKKMEKLKNLKNGFFQSNTEFRCVHCGSPVKELYKTYSPTIQKLSG